VESEEVVVSRRAEGVVLNERRILSCFVHCIDRANGRDTLSRAIVLDRLDVCSRVLPHLKKI